MFILFLFVVSWNKFIVTLDLYDNCMVSFAFVFGFTVEFVWPDAMILSAKVESLFVFHVSASK